MNPKSYPKPTAVKLINLLIMIKILIASIFFLAVVYWGSSPEGSEPIAITLTFIAYVVLAIPTLYFTGKRNLTALRVSLALDFLASLPLLVYLGMLISGVLFFITFRKDIKDYCLKT